MLVKTLGDVSTGSRCRSRFLRIREALAPLWLSPQAVFIQTCSLDSSLLRANDIGDLLHHFWRENNRQVCFGRTDVLALTAGKVITVNLQQKQTLKRTGATV